MDAHHRDFVQEAYPKDTVLNSTFNREANPIVSAFQATCLSSNDIPGDMGKLALTNWWQIARDVDLD